MWWCSTRWSSTSRARGIWPMCWQWRCDCWHRAGRCSSATCATTACRARFKPRSRWPAPPPPTPPRSANEFSAPCSASPNCCWPRSFSPAGPPTIRRWPDSTFEVKRGSADNELNRYRYDVTVHKTPTPVRSLATAPTWAWTHCAGLRGLHTRLISQRPAAVRVTEIPRAGLITDVGIEHGPGRRATRRRGTRPSHRHRDPRHRHPRAIAPPRRNHRIPRRGDLGRPTRHPRCRLPHPHRPGPRHAPPLTDLYLPPTGAHQSQHPRQ